MDELKFALRCFGFTLLIAFLMQIRVSGVSLEARTEEVLKRSQLTEYLQKASEGGAKLLTEGYFASKNFIADSTRSLSSAMGSNHANTRENRAERR
jgi:hypothetical protein